MDPFSVNPFAVNRHEIEIEDGFVKNEKREKEKERERERCKEKEINTKKKRYTQKREIDTQK